MKEIHICPLKINSTRRENHEKCRKMSKMSIYFFTHLLVHNYDFICLIILFSFLTLFIFMNIVFRLPRTKSSNFTKLAISQEFTAAIKTSPAASHSHSHISWKTIRPWRNDAKSITLHLFYRDIKWNFIPITFFQKWKI